MSGEASFLDHAFDIWRTPETTLKLMGTTKDHKSLEAIIQAFKIDAKAMQERIDGLEANLAWARAKIRESQSCEIGVRYLVCRRHGKNMPTWRIEGIFDENSNLAIISAGELQAAQGGEWCVMAENRFQTRIL